MFSQHAGHEKSKTDLKRQEEANLSDAQGQRTVIPKKSTVGDNFSVIE